MTRNTINNINELFFAKILRFTEIVCGVRYRTALCARHQCIKARFCLQVPPQQLDQIKGTFRNLLNETKACALMASASDCLIGGILLASTAVDNP